MRTKLRSKFTLFFIVCAALLAFAGTAMALTSDTSGETSGTTSPSPTISSDKADYAPGELVTLTGSGWQDGESVNIKVNDTYGASWSRNVDVTANASGNVTDSFNLPDWFVSDYDVTATGAQSGTVTTTFTDANPNQVSVASPTSPAAVNQGSSATYGDVSVGFAGNSNPCTVTLSRAPAQPAVTTGPPANHRPADTAFPAGATANFGTTSLTGIGGDTKTSTLTVSTTNATPEGTYRFHVQATRQATPAGCQGLAVPDTISGQQLTLVVNDITAPSVAITSPANNSSTTNSTIDVSGTASDESGIQGVKVNGNAATLGTGNSWSYDDLSLDCGENTITAVATDTSANHNTKSTSITVTRTCDTTPPTLTVSHTANGSNGWNTSSPVTVNVSASDADSGLAGAPTCKDGTTNLTLTAGTAGNWTASVSGEGTHNISCSVSDNAGNSNSANDTVNIDTIAPGIAPGDVNNTTWRNSPLGPLSFTASDGGSGLASGQGLDANNGFALTASAESTKDSNGDVVPTTVSKTVSDVAGNTTTRSVSAKIDLTLPSVSASLDKTKASTGWFNIATGAPTVSFLCSDGLSGLASTCPSPHLFGNGENQSRSSGDIFDNAGNKNSAGVQDVDVDLSKPNNINFTGTNVVTDGATYPFGSVPDAPTGCTADDTFSGLKSCTLDGGYGTGVGSHTIKATATDNAGNVETKTLTYTVDPWDATGFYSPVGTTNSVFLPAPGTLPTVNDSGVWNTVKGGSTVPLKFNVFAGSTEKTSTSDIQSLQATKLAKCASDGVATADVVDFTTTDTTSLRYSGTPGIDGQFIQNWKTPKVAGETCYRTAVTFDDGSSIYAFFKLLK